jgi:hypothetical protein
MSTMLIEFSAVQMAIVICVGFVLTTLAGILVLRPYSRRWIHVRRNANDMIGFALASFATLYGILLGLLAVEAYQDFSAAKDAVSKQALTLATLFQDLDGFPQPLRARLQEGLRGYVAEALETHWSRDATTSSAASHSPRLRALLDQFLAFKPASKSEEIVHEEGVRQANVLIEQRRMLIAAAADGIPGALWCVVFLGAFLYMLLMCLFDMELHVHMVLGGVTALFLGAVVFLITALDNPFHGGVTVDSAPIESVREMMARPSG